MNGVASIVSRNVIHYYTISDTHIKIVQHTIKMERFLPLWSNIMARSMNIADRSMTKIVPSRKLTIYLTLIGKSDRETRQIRLFSGTWYAFGLSDATDSTVLRHVDPNHPLKSFTNAEGVEDHARCFVLCFESISSTIFLLLYFASLALSR